MPEEETQEGHVEVVEPIGPRVLVRKDEEKKVTRGGIHLPDDSEIPTITGRVVEISAVVENDDEYPIRKYDKVVYHPQNAIPVDLEAVVRGKLGGTMFVVPVEDIVAVIRKG